MADYIAAITKLTGYLPHTTGEKRDLYLRRIAEYALREASTAPLAPASEAEAVAADPADWTGPFKLAYERFLRGADEALIAQGKPAGRDGAERGSLTRDECIAIATKLGVLDELGGRDFFGHEPGPEVQA